MAPVCEIYLFLFLCGILVCIEIYCCNLHLGYYICKLMISPIIVAADLYVYASFISFDLNLYLTTYPWEISKYLGRFLISCTLSCFLYLPYYLCSLINSTVITVADWMSCIPSECSGQMDMVFISSLTHNG